MLNVLVADDSIFYRALLNSIVKSIDGMTLVGSARNGEDTLQKLKGANVDILILDLEMPIMDGLEVLRHLQNQRNSPVVIVCSALTTGGAKVTMEALKLGAYDVIAKPDGDSAGENFEFLSGQIQRLFDTFRKENLQTKAPVVARTPPVEVKAVPVKIPSRMMKVLTIGISTGGPKALLALLPLLPADFPGIITVVQHMPEVFIPSLVESLNRVTKMQVLIAEDGQQLKQSHIYISPGARHFGVIKNKFGILEAYLSDDEPENHCRPSVDFLYRSLAKVCASQCVGLVMTGMGNDGTIGAATLKQSGAYIIAQEESSCTVYGMPRSIVIKGIQDQIVALGDLEPTIKKLFRY